jgi:hypothetical protein
MRPNYLRRTRYWGAAWTHWRSTSSCGVFVDHVLVVLTEQLQGHSSTLWLIDVEQRAAHLHSVYEDGRVVLARDADHPNARQLRYWSSDDPEWVALQMNRPFLHRDPADDPELNYTLAQRARFSASGIHAPPVDPVSFWSAARWCVVGPDNR